SHSGAKDGSQGRRTRSEAQRASPWYEEKSNLKPHRGDRSYATTAPYQHCRVSEHSHFVDWCWNVANPCGRLDLTTLVVTSMQFVLTLLATLFVLNQDEKAPDDSPESISCSCIVGQTLVLGTSKSRLYTIDLATGTLSKP